MTEQEKEALKAEILSDLEEKFKGVAIREDVHGVLAETRNKWFKSPSGGIESKSPMYDAFGACTYWKTWELVRKLVCLICGCGYVRQIENKASANEIAESLCNLIYDLRIREKEAQDGKAKHTSSADECGGKDSAAHGSN